MKGLVSGPAGPATSPRGAHGRRRTLGGGRGGPWGEGRDARSHRAHARRAPPARRRFAAAARPAPTVRTLGEEEPPRPRSPRHPGHEACKGPLEGTGGHLSLPREVREPGLGPAIVPFPSPTKSGRGSAWPCYRRVRSGFSRPLELCERSERAARFPPPGAPEPSAGTRCAAPSSPLPQGPKVASPAPRPSGLRGRGSTPRLSGVPTRARPGG